MKHIANNQQAVKIGIVVENIEEAVNHYATLFGIEVPKINVPNMDQPFEPTENSFTWFRGENRPNRTKFVSFKIGVVTIELLEPLDEPSPWNEYKEKHGQGVHFITFTINGFNQHIDFVEKHGFPLNTKGEYGSGRYSYFDSDDALGVMLGLQEMGPKQD